MKHPELVHDLELLPCAIRDGMLYIPHADGQWVSAAKLQPFSLEIIKYWRAEQSAAPTATPLVQEAEPVAMPTGWVPCTITYEEGEDPEEVAFGPQRMMDRLKKWLDAYFAKVYAERYPVATGVQATEVAPATAEISRLTGEAYEFMAAAIRADSDQISGQQEQKARARIDRLRDLASMAAKPATEVAGPVVGAASEKRIAAIMALVDEFAISRAHATQHAENAHAVRYRDDARAEIVRSLRLATPSQQEDAQPVGFAVQTNDPDTTAAICAAKDVPPGTLLYTRAAPPARSSVPLTEAQVNHLRRLLGWASCEVGQSPGEMVQGVRELAAKGLDTDEAGKARLLRAHQTASNVPKYIRAAIKALGPVVVSPQSPQEREAGAAIDAFWGGTLSERSKP